MKIKSIITLISCCMLITFKSYSQDVIATAGCTFQTSQGSLSWTIGESITETFTKTNSILTQGFHQSNLTITAIHENDISDINIKVYPNPATDFVNIKVNGFDEMSYQVFDINGSLIENKEIIDLKTTISFENLSSATYIVRILKRETEITTYKIIKK